jgi:hypothetical protein
MEIIEIKQKESSFYFTIIFLPLLVIGFAYFVFLSGSTQITEGTRYTFFAFLLYSVYQVYAAIKKHKQNKPKLIVSEFSIEIFGDFKSSLYLWQDIKNWKIEFEDGSHYLVLETYTIKETVPIWGMEKTPDEIEVVLNKFVGKKRSN